MLSFVGSIAARGVFPYLYSDNLLGHSLSIQSDDKRLKQTTESKLFQDKIKSLKDIYGLKGSLYVRRGKAVNAAYVIENNYTVVVGNNLSINSPKIIYIDDFIQRTDLEASKFWLSYACRQLKNNDLILKNAVLLVINLAAAFFSSSLYTVILIGIVSHITIQNTLGRYSANRAFSKVLEHASPDEIMGALRLLNARFTVEREISQQSRAGKIQIWFRHILYGNPSLENFINKAERVMKSKYKLKNFSEITSDSKYLTMKNYLLTGENLLSSTPKR